MAKKKRLDDPEALSAEERPAWWDHDWTTEEVLFAQAFLRTGSPTRAYREAFPDKCRTEVERLRAQPKGHRLAHMPWMESYCEGVREHIKRHMLLTPENVLEELGKLGFANMTDFVVLQADGTPQFDMSGLSREQAAAIQEMTIDTYMDGRDDDAREVKSVKVKLAPKLGALEALGKHFKLFTDVLETNDVSDVADRIRAKKQELRERKKGDDDADELKPDGTGDDD